MFRQGSPEGSRLPLQLVRLVIRTGQFLQIAQGNHTHQMHLSIEHGQSAKLPLVHEMSRLVDALAFPAVNGRKCHHFAHWRGLGITPLCRRSHGEVTRSQQTDDFPPFAHGKYGNIMNAHLARGFAQRGVRSNDRDIFLHDAFKLHGVWSVGSPLNGQWQSRTHADLPGRIDHYDPSTGGHDQIGDQRPSVPVGG